MPKPKPSLPPATIAKIARLLFNGFDNEEIGLLVNLPENVVRLIRKGSLNPEVRISCLVLKDRAIEKIKAGKGKLTGICWFMERRYPRQYAKAETQISLAAGPVTNNTLVISAEVAEGLLKRSKQVVTELDQLIADKQPGEVPE